MFLTVADPESNVGGVSRPVRRAERGGTGGISLPVGGG